jgi:hypothetical protein
MRQPLSLYSIFCGLIGIPTAFLFGLGALFGVMAIVLGRRARRASAGEGRPGLAIVGMALGAIAVVLGLAVLI